MTIDTNKLYFTDWPGSVLEVTGSDRATFLHNMCTADVKQMAVGESREAFFTNVKGHVLYHAVLHNADDRVVVVVFTNDAGPLASQLNRYIIREEVELTQRKEQSVLVVGDDQQLADNCIKLPLGPPTMWLALGDEVPSALDTAGFVASDAAAFAAVRVAAGWPLGGVEFGEATLPQELSRDSRAISFTKGCYLGQETIARLDALGHVNKQIVRVRALDGAQLAAGAQLTDGDKQVGTITTVGQIDDGYAGLAMVRRGSNAAGTQLTTDTGKVVVESLAE